MKYFAKNFMKYSKRKTSQQLVEFLLIAPFLVILLGVLTEYAYALNINMTLTQGLKTVTASIYSEIKPGMSGSDIQANVLNDLTKYMQGNNAPVTAENKLTVGYSIEGQTSIFMAHYTYVPAFTLPNTYFHILPDKFDFLSTAAVPSAFLSSNNYKTSINSTKLDGIWSASDFSSLSNFNGLEKGIMKSNDYNSGRDKMLFLIPVKNQPDKYSLVHWNGTVDNCILSATTGIISGAECGSYSDKNLIEYLRGNNFYNVCFVHDTDLQNIDINTTILSDYWAYATGGSSISVSDSTDISDKSVDGVLKRMLALTDLSTNLSIGNYDNATVSAYNPNVSATTSYNMTPFGSIIFMGTTLDNAAIAAIINNNTPNEYSYNFNQ